VKKGYQPAVHDFSITDMNGVDLTGNILADSGYSMFMVSGKLNEADSSYLSKGFDLGKELIQYGISFYILTATASDDLQYYLNGLNFCTVDETTLKSMVRANPGYMLLKDGVIQGKWSWATLPGKQWFSGLSAGSQKETAGNFADTFSVLSLIASFLLILIILGINIKKYFF